MAENSFPCLPHTLQLSHHPWTLAVSYVHIPRPVGRTVDKNGGIMDTLIPNRSNLPCDSMVFSSGKIDDGGDERKKPTNGGGREL